MATDAGRALILTGSRGVGKSTACAEFIARAQSAGYRCGGILTLTQEGKREVVDVSTGRRRPLTWSPGAGPTVVQGRFYFCAETLAWAERVLSRAVPCDLLVVDEIGPLEVERGEGWAGALDVLRGGAYTLALVVVRPELTAAVREALDSLHPEVVETTRGNRARLPAALFATLRQEE